jgi:hypothetical protein
MALSNQDDADVFPQHCMGIHIECLIILDDPLPVMPLFVLLDCFFAIPWHCAYGPLYIFLSSMTPLPSLIFPFHGR